MAKSVSFLVEERRFEFPLDDLSVNAVKQKFIEFAENDPALCGTLGKSPLFYDHSSECNKDVELSEASVLHHGHEILVK